MVKLSTYAVGLLSTVFFNSATPQAQLADAPRRLLRISESAVSSSTRTENDNDTSLTKDEVTMQLQKAMTTFNIVSIDLHLEYCTRICCYDWVG